MKRISITQITCGLLFVALLWSVSMSGTRVPTTRDPNDNGAAKLLGAKSIRITWGKGATADWAPGAKEPKVSTGPWSTKGQSAEVVYDAIDLKNNSARVIGNQGAGDVVALGTASGISFLETTPTGSPIFTTVFFDRTTDGAYMAVMSRHMGAMGGSPMPSQWYGTCVVLEGN